jgi:FkbM family methyltransferase
MNISEHARSVPRIFKLFKNPFTFYFDKLHLYGRDSLISIRLRNGLRYKVHSGNTEVSIFPEVFFTDVYQRFFSAIGPSSNILDIGANIGVVSVAAARGLKDGKVHAFEINPAVIPLLVQNIELNGITDKITVHPVGIAGKTESRELYFEPYHWGGARIVGGSVAAQGQPTTVQCIKFSEIFALTGFDKIDLIKMDIEGAEREVFASMTADDFNKIGAMLLEYHLPYAPAREMKDLLEGYGFTVTVSNDFNALFADKK